MLTRARSIIQSVASLEASTIDPLKRMLLAIIARAVRAAAALRAAAMWVFLLELALGAAAVLLLRRSDGSFGAASMIVGGLFAVLLVALGAAIYMFNRVLAIPAMLESTAAIATKTIGDAKADYAAVLEKGGWKGTLHTLWAAGKILRIVRSVLVEHNENARGLYALAALMSPPGWIALLILAMACVAAPLVAGCWVIVRAVLS